MPDTDTPADRASLLALSEDLSRLKARVDAALAGKPEPAPTYNRPLCQFCRQPILRKRSDATYCDAPACVSAFRQMHSRRQAQRKAVSEDR